MAHVGDEILARVLEPLQSCEIMEYENGSMTFAFAIENGGRIDFEEAISGSRDSEFPAENGSLFANGVDHPGNFMNAESLDDRARAQVCGDAEEPEKRPVGDLDPALSIEQQQPFGHTVEKGSLAHLNLLGSEALLAAKAVDLTLAGSLNPVEAHPPPEMQANSSREEKTGDDGPEHVRSVTKIPGGRKRES